MPPTAFDPLRRDFAYTVRMMRRNPAFTTVALTTIALGIGVTTAIFSIVDTVVFRDLPYAAAERLVKICGTGPRDPACNDDHSAAELERIGQQTDLFESVAADDGMGVTVTAPDGSRESLGVGLVTTNWLRTLGVRPIRGRDFNPEEGVRGRDGVLIITHEYWMRRFGSSVEALGSAIAFDGTVHTVVGVLPPNVLRHSADVLKPLVTSTYQDRSLDIIARLNAEVSVRQSDARVQALGQQMAREIPANATRRLGVSPLARNYAEVGDRARRGLVLMLGAVGLLLLVACVNVANLLLARVASRRRESVVRAALGASRARLLRQSLVETLVLFAIGGALGLVIASLLLDSVSALAIAGGYMSERMTVALDRRVLVVAGLMSLATGLLFGLGPAIHMSRVELNAGLRGMSPTTTRRGGRARGLLIASEVAFTLVLLAGFGLLVRSFARVYATSGGFDPENAIVTASDGGRSFPEAMVFWRAALEQARGADGVVSAALTSRPPANGVRSKPFAIEGGVSLPEADAPLADDVLVSDGYFDTLRIPVMRGRSFRPSDNEAGHPVVIVSHSFAQRHFGADDPLGRRVRLLETLPMTCCATPGPVEGVWREIVGVVGDVRQANLDDAPAMTIYRPYGQIVEHDMYLIARARSAADAGRLLRELSPILTRVDPARDWWPPRPMWQLIHDSDSIRLRRFVLVLLGGFSALALLLAAVGVYGVAVSAVAERTKELGIRIALGASRSNIYAQVIRQTAAPAVAGALIGAAGGAALMRVIQSMLFGISPFDIVTHLAVTVTLAAIVVAASWIPARRATRIDPLVALRHE